LIFFSLPNQPVKKELHPDYIGISGGGLGMSLSVKPENLRLIVDSIRIKSIPISVEIYKVENPTLFDK
jgi:hypothetical protein